MQRKNQDFLKYLKKLKLKAWKNKMIKMKYKKMSRINGKMIWNNLSYKESNNILTMDLKWKI